MESKKETTSMITLRMYVDLLCRIGNGEVINSEELEDIEKRAVRELLRSGLVSDDAREVMGRVTLRGALAITPEGIAALSAWDTQLKKSTWLWKFGDTLLRFLWVMVGALAASLSDLLKYLT